MISINKTQKRVVLTMYLGTEEQYGLVWVQAVSSKSIQGIGHFMQIQKHHSTWVETMRKRFIKLNKEYKR